MRYIVDETALESVGSTQRDVAVASLVGLADLLTDLREVGDEAVGIISGWGSVGSWGEVDLATVLTSDSLLDRDVRVLLLGALGKCAHIDDQAEHLDPQVNVDGEEDFDSYGIAFAHSGLLAEPVHARAVISLAHFGAGGPHDVLSNGTHAEVCFVVTFRDERLFWRTLAVAEDLGEGSLLRIADRAFPDLLFAETLNCKKFAGGYMAVKATLVEHLAALSDGWTRAYTAETGNSDAISMRLGIKVSRDSHSTRASPELMRLRDVEYGGATYRCEWHSKLQPHQNRIHFHPATDDALASPLIGIFCDHLPTEG
jgi:hypothetical protein